jgi:hypothetical protein
VLYLEDEELYNLLIRPSTEEEDHSLFINKANKLIKDSSDLPSDVCLNNDTKQKVVNHFPVLEQKIRTNKLTEDITNFTASPKKGETWVI